MSLAGSSSAPSPEEPRVPPPPGGFPDYAAASAYLRALIRYGIKYGLEGFAEALRRLDHPERAARWVHVAGTNGKGSVSAMVESMLRAHGYPTVLFTSPHLVSERERFRWDGLPVGDAPFIAAMDRMAAVTESMEADGLEVPTFFEACTGLAFTLAGMRPGCWGVAEVGLGGRLDATNLLEPACAVVTSIGLDHTKTLGETLDQIAAEKAGIAKPGRPLLVAPGIAPEIQAVLRAEGQARGARVEVPRTALTRARLDGPAGRMRFDLATEAGRYPDLELPLLGEHQLGNAALAVRSLEVALANAGCPVDPEAVRAGLAGVRWPCRFDVRDHHGLTLVLDAVHNPQGMDAFMQAWRARFPGRQAVVLFGACSDKSVDAMLGPLLEIASELVLAQASTKRATPAAQLEAQAQELGATMPLSRPEGVAAAWQHAQARARARGDLLVVCGSLYLLGDVLALPGAPPVLP